MPLSNANALLLSNDAMAQGLVINDDKRLQLNHIFPFFEIFGDRLALPRTTVATLGSATWDAGATAVGDTPATPTNPNASFSLKLLNSAFKNNYTAQMDMSNVNDQAQIQVAAAIRRMLFQFWTTFQTGNEGVNPQEFNGLRQIVTGGQTITANAGAGGQPSLTEFDTLLGLVLAGGGWATDNVVLLSSQKGFDAWRRAHYLAGLMPSEYRDLQVPAVGGGWQTARVSCCRGVMFLVDDSTPNNEAPGTYTSIYALKLGRDGLHGIVPTGTRRNMFQVSRTLVDGVAQDVTVVSWAVGLALAAQTAVARMQQVNNA